MSRIGFGPKGKVYGVGFCSTDLKSWENGKVTRCYDIWKGMLKRGYDQKCKNRNPTYQLTCTMLLWLGRL